MKNEICENCGKIEKEHFSIGRYCLYPEFEDELEFSEKFKPQNQTRQTEKELRKEFNITHSEIGQNYTLYRNGGVIECYPYSRDAKYRRDKIIEKELNKTAENQSQVGQDDGSNQLPMKSDKLLNPTAQNQSQNFEDGKKRPSGASTAKDVSVSTAGGFDTLRGIFDTTDLEKEIEKLKKEIRKIKMNNVGFREAYYFGDKAGEKIDVFKDKIVQERQRLKAEVAKSFNKLIEMFESVNEYSDAQYWVIEEKKRLFGK